MDERDLIRRAREGDRDAFGELVRLYQARLRAFAARYVPRSEDVYDLVQDAFLDALEHLDRFDPKQDFAPWLRALCRNRILNHFRSRRVRRSAAAALIDAALEERWSAEEPADIEAAAVRVRALRRCVDLLEPTQRRLVDLRYREEVPLNELARRLERSAAALSMALVRIRAALMKCLDRRLEIAEP